MEYVGKEEEHGHDDHGHGDHHEVGYTKYGIHKKSLNDPVTLVDFLKPEYKRGM